MNLIIVESPTKAKTISRFLNGDFVVRSSYGHIRDLPKGELGVDVENNFEPKYVIPTKARKNLTVLKKDAAKATEIILATDEDREGESISWHLAQALGLDAKSQTRSKIKKVSSKKPAVGNQLVKRIVFHEITESAIQGQLMKIWLTLSRPGGSLIVLLVINYLLFFGKKSLAACRPAGSNLWPSD
jgi:DNA topoisomerase IA